MKTVSKMEPVTPEGALAAVITMLEKSSAKFDREMEKLRLSQAETAQQMKESRKDYDRRMKKFEETIGSWAFNQGCFAEEYFFNSFENGMQNFFGQKFDDIRKNIKGIEIEDEYDILLINGQAVGVVETKFKAHENDIPKVLKKADTFRANFPKYQNHKVYLGLASMAFYPKLEDECVKQGIAVIKQVGDAVVINDKHLKAF
jgi:hypothetical protein